MRLSFLRHLQEIIMPKILLNQTVYAATKECENIYKACLIYNWKYGIYMDY